MTPRAPEDDILERAEARRRGDAPPLRNDRDVTDPLRYTSSPSDTSEEPPIFRESIDAIREWMAANRELRRITIITTLHAILEKQDWITAAWLGGADAYGRVDRWSDIDLFVEVPDEHARAVLGVVENALEELAGIDHRWEVPAPTWHGGPERVYRLAEASPYLLVDVTVVLASKGRPTTNADRHGSPWVLFDRTGATVPAAPETDALADRIDERLRDLQVRVPMLHVQVDKELMRGDALAAMEMFRRFMHGPLIELIRMRHAPSRWDFGLRQTSRDLPFVVRQRLEQLLYVSDLDELREAWLHARRWMQDLLEELANEPAA